MAMAVPLLVTYLCQKDDLIRCAFSWALDLESSWLRIRGTAFFKKFQSEKRSANCYIFFLSKLSLNFTQWHIYGTEDRQTIRHEAAIPPASSISQSLWNGKHTAQGKQLTKLNWTGSSVLFQVLWPTVWSMRRLEKTTGTIKNSRNCINKC